MTAPANGTNSFLQVATLVRWEWFKLQRRWMPWILLALMVLISQLVLWVTFALLQGAEGARNGFTLPGAVTTALRLAQAIGSFAVVILTASVIGTEYGWGTLRSALARGTGRWQYLAAKLLLLVLLAGGALLAVALLAAFSAAIAGGLKGAGGGQWADLLETFGRAWVALIPTVALAAAVAVVTGSAAMATGITLAYQFVEGIAAAILISLVDWFDKVADYLLGRSISAWTEGSSGGGPFAEAMGALPGQWHALAVMAAYTIVLCAGALWLFQRRDVKGPSGGG